MEHPGHGRVLIHQPQSLLPPFDLLFLIGPIAHTESLGQTLHFSNTGTDAGLAMAGSLFLRGILSEGKMILNRLFGCGIRLRQ